jgi:hypothetical protein
VLLQRFQLLFRHRRTHHELRSFLLRQPQLLLVMC